MKRRNFLQGLAASVVLPLSGQSKGQEIEAPEEHTSPPMLTSVASEPAPTTTTTLSLDTLFPGVMDLFPGKNDKEKRALLEQLASKIRKHEDYRGIAYADPNYANTRSINIGYGFNLNVPEPFFYIPNTDKGPGEKHDDFQHNDRLRKDPSSAMLWQAVGLPLERLEATLQRFYTHMKPVENIRDTFTYFKTLHEKQKPDITPEEGERLLIGSILHATYNAPSYAKEYNLMTPGQKLGTIELIYQIGTRLEGFVDTFKVFNDTSYRTAADGKQLEGEKLRQSTEQHWKAVQYMFSQSRWFKLYNNRAVDIIARFDPEYDANPAAAKTRLRALVNNPVGMREYTDKILGKPAKQASPAEKPTLARWAERKITPKHGVEHHRR